MATANRPRNDETPQMWVQPYYKSFNGIRALAVLMVFIHHYGSFWHAEWLQGWTWAGVDLFFVLSGFLITGILFDSQTEQHFFRNFYIRRSLRIFPVYYGLLLVILAVTPLLHLHYTHRFFSFFFYAGNLVLPFSEGHGNPTMIWIVRHGTQMPVANIGHFWSLCVEEQFYLVWPAVVWLVRSRRHLMGICIVVSAMTLALRVILRPHMAQVGAQGYLIHWSTYTRCDTLLIGAWIALWLRGDKFTYWQIKKTAHLLFWGSSTIFVVFLLRQPVLHNVNEVIGNSFISTYGYTLIGLAAAGILLFALDDGGLLSRLLQMKPLSRLGSISYGFYIYHLLPFTCFEILCRHFGRLTFLVPPIAFAYTLLVSHLSFRYFESPFLRLKDRFAPGHRSTPSG